MIHVERLRYRYPAAQQDTLKDLSFSVDRGEIFGFLGPSGAGKSTTQKILIGLLTGYEGRVGVMGRELSSWSADFYEKVGVCFELPNHYLKLTALENLQYFSSLYSGEKEEILALMERVGLAGDANLRVVQFSKGMKVRLNFIRALLHKPELIFLDEPTEGIDPVNASIIKTMIRERKNAGHTIFLTTHNMTVADDLCDRVAFIVDGEIRLCDSPRNLKLQYGLPTVKVEYRENGELRGQEFPLRDLGENSAFLQTLRRHEVQTLHSQETTLEKIFIDITGRSLSS